MNRIDEIWEELSDVCRQLGNDMMFSKLLFTDLIGFLSRGFLIKESKGVDVFMKQDMKDVGFQQGFVRLENPSEWSFIDNDNVGGDRVVRPDESIEGGPNFLETEHESSAGSFLVFLYNFFDFFKGFDDILIQFGKVGGVLHFAIT